MTPTQINLEELKKLLLTNWTKFIDPNKLISFVLTIVRDIELPILKNPSFLHKKSLKITMSDIFINQNKNFTLWVEFVIPKKEETVIGTCELELNLLTGELDHLQTTGSVMM